MCKRALNRLDAIYLRLGKIVMKRVTVVKFRVDNRGSDGTGGTGNAPYKLLHTAMWTVFRPDIVELPLYERK